MNKYCTAFCLEVVNYNFTMEDRNIECSQYTQYTHTQHTHT